MPEVIITPPDGDAMLREAAARAERAGDWAGAKTLWLQAISQNAADADLVIRAAGALQQLRQFAEADGLFEAAFERLGRLLPLLIEYARVAHRQADWAQAKARWEAVLAAFPDHPAGHAGQGIALLMLGQHDAADRVLAAGTARFADHEDMAVDYARVAFQQQNWALAFARFMSVCERFPESEAGLEGLSATLLRLGRLDEMEALLVGAVAKNPVSAGLRLEYARAAHRREDWPEALRRWMDLLILYPENEAAVAGTAIALQMVGRMAEGDALLISGFAKFPKSLDIAVEYARVPHRKRDWPQALLRWRDVMARFPDQAEGYVSAAITLLELRDYAALDAHLAEAVARFPTHEKLADYYAYAAEEQGDWRAAAKRWQVVAERFPQNERFRAGLGAATFNLKLAEEEFGTKAAPELVAAADEDPAADEKRDLMMQFESLGSGCEFGLVQRHYGAEPISVLRWGAVPVGGLVACLDAQFVGIGEPENVALFELGNSGEYFFRNTKYSLEMHTFVKIAGSDYDRLYAQQCRRVKYLAGKFMEALRTEPDALEKIFVYKRHIGSISEEEIAQLFGALRRYGAHYVLFVRPADEGHADLTLEDRGDRLFVGYIAGLSETSNAHEINYESWLGLLRKVKARAQREVAVAPVAEMADVAPVAGSAMGEPGKVWGRGWLPSLFQRGEGGRR